MVKLVQKTDVEIDGGRVEKTSPGLEELAALADQNEASGQAENAKTETKEVSAEIKLLAAEIEMTLDGAAVFAESGMWWFTPEQFERQWGEKSRKKIAVAAAMVMQKHGWNLSDLKGKYGPYIALAVALGQPVAVTVVQYKKARASLESTPGGENAASS